MRITIRNRINKLINLKRERISIFYKGLSLTTENNICTLYLDSRIHYSMINKAY